MCYDQGRRAAFTCLRSVAARPTTASARVPALRAVFSSLLAPPRDGRQAVWGGGGPSAPRLRSAASAPLRRRPKLAARGRLAPPRPNGMTAARRCRSSPRHEGRAGPPIAPARQVVRRLAARSLGSRAGRRSARTTDLRAVLPPRPTGRRGRAEGERGPATATATPGLPSPARWRLRHVLAFRSAEENVLEAAQNAAGIRLPAE